MSKPHIIGRWSVEEAPLPEVAKHLARVSGGSHPLVTALGVTSTQLEALALAARVALMSAGVKEIVKSGVGGLAVHDGGSDGEIGEAGAAGGDPWSGREEREPESTGAVGGGAGQDPGADG